MIQTIRSNGENMMIEETMEFCSKTNVENYFFHSFGLFHTMKRINPEVEMTVLRSSSGNIRCTVSGISSMSSR